MDHKKKNALVYTIRKEASRRVSAGWRQRKRRGMKTFLMLLQKFRYNPMKFAGVNKKETCNLPLIRFKSSSTFAVDAFAWLCAFSPEQSTNKRKDEVIGLPWSRHCVSRTTYFFLLCTRFFPVWKKTVLQNPPHREAIVSIIRFLLHITWSNVNNSHLTWVWRDTFSVDKATNGKSEIRLIARLKIFALSHMARRIKKNLLNVQCSHTFIHNKCKGNISKCS